MAVPTKWLADFTLNGVGGSGEVEPYVSARPDGGFHIVGTDIFAGDRDVAGWSFDGAGIGSLFPSSSHSETSATQTSRNGSVAYLEDGRYVVVWTTEPAAGGGNERDVRAEVYFADGTIAQTDFLVIGGVNDQQDPAVATSPNGGFVIAYTDPDAGTNEVKAKFYNQAGSLITTQNVETGTSYDGSSNTIDTLGVTSLSNGNYVIVWTSGVNSFARIYSSNGGALTGEFEVLDNTIALWPKVTELADGRFLVVASHSTVKGEIYNADGSLSVDEFSIGSSPTNFEQGTVAAALEDGRFVVVWVDANFEIRGRVYSPDGTPDSAEFAVASVTTGAQGNPTIDVLADGRFVVAWETNENGSPEIKATIFDPREIGQDIVGSRFDDTLFGTDFADVMAGADGDDTLVGSGGNDLILGNAGNNEINGNSGKDTIRGGTGDDILNGGGGNDEVSGEVGDDTIRGGGGHDRLLGNGGEDNISGNAGNDFISGGSSDDTIAGNAGNDKLRGNSGDDIISGGDGNDNLQGRDGDDVLNGGKGSDVMFGDAGADVMNGGAGADVMNGGSGADTMNGGGGNDIMRGNGGADSIDGGKGNDRMTGNGGLDTFFFSHVNWGDDIITDFNNGSEKMDMTGTGVAAGMLNVVNVGGNAIVDFGGSSSITLLGEAGNINAGDFIF